MKVFFWLSGAAYVFLYFWAAYIYEGFDMWLAIALFVATLAMVYWQRKRSQRRQSLLMDTAPVNQSVEPNQTPQPLSLWSSPLPYMLILVTVILVSLMF
ncbi:hypothetical protein [Alteromonas flava]|uniref:hypothetical protein n=1 Tax=Alteromonas flava TaxID=2048003 RepID=UPI000C28B311|nr:hypothetical protein [Alteromonas flava]